MRCIHDLLEDYKKLPTSELTLHVGGKSLFGFGLGLIAAKSLRGNTRTIGLITLLIATLLTIPATVRILSKRCH